MSSVSTNKQQYIKSLRCFRQFRNSKWVSFPLFLSAFLLWALKNLNAKHFYCFRFFLCNGLMVADWRLDGNLSPLHSLSNIERFTRVFFNCKMYSSAYILVRIIKGIFKKINKCQYWLVHNSESSQSVHLFLLRFIFYNCSVIPNVECNKCKSFHQQATGFIAFMK